MKKGIHKDHTFITVVGALAILAGLANYFFKDYNPNYLIFMLIIGLSLIAAALLLDGPKKKKRK